MWRRPPNKERAEKSSDPPTPTTLPEFTREEQASMLQIAHAAVAAAVQQHPYKPESTSKALATPRGVFTTLYRDGQLRGCVGYVIAVRPLLEAVAETARAAALEDPRFAPIEPAELPEIKVSLSVLSPTFPIDPARIEIGSHGLVITQHGRRGLLLPQVATEHAWDVTTFLEQTCRKAGLPVDAWKHGATVEAFTAQVFRDPECPD